MGAILNDFRDILDPTQRIPDSFISGYSHEMIERDNITEELSVKIINSQMSLDEKLKRRTNNDRNN